MALSSGNFSRDIEGVTAQLGLPRSVHCVKECSVLTILFIFLSPNRQFIEFQETNFGMNYV
jgi:hypothetical protein